MNRTASFTRQRFLIYFGNMAPAFAARGFAVALILGAAAMPSLRAQIDRAVEFEQRNLPVLQRLWDSGEYEETGRACTQVMTYGLSSPLWHIMRVRALAELGRKDEALSAADAMIHAHEEDMTSWLAKFRLHQSLGQQDEAKEALARIQELARNKTTSTLSADDLIALGEAALAAGADAKKVMTQYLEPAKKKDKGAALAEACLALGELALEKGDFARAAKEFREGLKARPSSADLRFGLARAFENSDRGKCLQALQQVLDGNPHHANALVLAAELEIAEEKFDEAKKSLDAAIEVNADKPEAHALKAVLALLVKDDQAKADKAIAAAMKQRANNADVHHLIGRCLSHAYRFAEGEKHQRIALQSDPTHQRAKLQLCNDLFRLGHEDEAWKLAKEVADADGYNVQAHNILLLEKEMKNFVTREQDGFILRMTKQDEQIYADRALELLHDAREKLGTKYGMKFDKPVLVEFFPSQQDFAIRTFGHLGGQGMLGVCTGTVITMNRPGGLEARRTNWESTLWHEFCHVVTLGVTKNKMPRWLSEGISVYEEGLRDPTLGMKMNAEFRKMTLDDETLTPVAEMSHAFLDADSGEKLLFAYFESAQAVEHLISKYGIEKFRGILRDLANGMRINDAIARNTAPLEKISQEFKKEIRQHANALAAKADWSEPEDDELDVHDAEAVAKYLQKHPQNLFALRRHARNQLAGRKFDEAIATARKLIALFPEDIASGCGYELAAAAYHGAAKLKEEAEVLREWVKRASDATTALQRLIVLDADAKNWSAVERSARLMLAVNPFLKQPHELLASALEEQKRGDDAVASLTKLQLLGADNPADVNFRLARLLRDKDRESSRRYVLDALADAPRHRAALNLLEELHEHETPKP